MVQDLSQNINLPILEKGEGDAVYINTGVEDSVASAQKQMEKMAPIDKAENVSLKKVTEHLNKGATLLKMCQRHYQGGRPF